MSATTPFTISGPEGLLPVLPHMLGHQPTGSIVAVALHDKRIGMVMRVDTPTTADEIAAMITTSIPPMLREAPSAVIVFGYETVTDDAVPAVSGLAAALTSLGITVLDQVIVAATHWRHLTCSCCPPTGQPLPSADHPTALEISLATGSSPAPSRDALSARLAATVRSHAVGRECDRLTDSTPADPTDAALAWGQILTAAAPVTDLPDQVLALAAVAVDPRQDQRFRDALLSHLCPDTVALEAFDRCTLQAVQDSITLSGADDSMTAEQLNRIFARLTETCAALPDQYAVAPLTILATFGWWTGRGTIARIALERARATDPSYRLALLIEQVLDLGIRPS